MTASRIAAGSAALKKRSKPKHEEVSSKRHKAAPRAVKPAQSDAQASLPDRSSSEVAKTCSSDQQQARDVQHAVASNASVSTSSQGRQVAQQQPLQQAAQCAKHGDVAFEYSSAQAASGVQKSARAAQHAEQQTVGAARNTKRAAEAQQPMQMSEQGAQQAQQAAQFAGVEPTSQTAQAQHVQPESAQTQPAQGSPAGSTEQETAYHVVEEIVAHIPDNGGLQAWRKSFVVKWEGYETTTSEPFGNLAEDAPSLMQAYCREAGLQMPQPKKRVAQQRQQQAQLSLRVRRVGIRRSQWHTVDIQCMMFRIMTSSAFRRNAVASGNTVLQDSDC